MSMLTAGSLSMQERSATSACLPTWKLRTHVHRGLRYAVIAVAPHITVPVSVRFNAPTAGQC